MREYIETCPFCHGKGYWIGKEYKCNECGRVFQLEEV